MYSLVFSALTPAVTADVRFAQTHRSYVAIIVALVLSAFLVVVPCLIGLKRIRKEISRLEELERANLEDGQSALISTKMKRKKKRVAPDDPSKDFNKNKLLVSWFNAMENRLRTGLRV